MWPNLQETADLVTFNEEILNGNFHFLCSENLLRSCNKAIKFSFIDFCLNGVIRLIWLKLTWLSCAKVKFSENLQMFKYSKTPNMWKVSTDGVFSGPYFPAFGLNTRKHGPEKTPYLDTFHAVPKRVSETLSWKIIALKISINP